MHSRILIVEDEAHLAHGLKLNLEAEGFIAEIVSDGETALKTILENPPDLAILDVMLPGMNGFDVCEQARSAGSRTPVLFLTARSEEDERIRGLDLGGDDYLTKPFSVRELIQRIRAILRREEWYAKIPGSGSQFAFGGNRVDFTAYKAWTASGLVTLTQKECMLIKLLVEHESEVVSRNQILDHVWGYNRYPTTRTVDNMILRLRKYFEKDPRKPQHIHTLYGVGYRFTANPESE